MIKTIVVGFIYTFPNIFVLIDKNANFYISFEYEKEKYIVVDTCADDIIKYLNNEIRLINIFNNSSTKYTCQLINDYFTLTTLHVNTEIPRINFIENFENPDEYSAIAHDDIWIETYINRLYKNPTEVILDLKLNYFNNE